MYVRMLIIFPQIDILYALLNNQFYKTLEHYSTVLGCLVTYNKHTYVRTYRYCSHFKNPALLHELILAIGYFCVLNHDNQVP